MVEWDWYTYLLFGTCMAFAFICLRQYDYIKGKNYFGLVVLGLLPCFILFAFRHSGVGKDLHTYAIMLNQAKFGSNYFFHNLLSGSLLSEPLSMGVAYVSYYFGGIQAFIFITSLVQYFFIVVLLIRLHKKGFNVAILFLLFFSIIQLRSCSMVRNGLAITVSFCAYTYLLDSVKQHKWFWFYGIIALGFHNSALINIPLYFICKNIEGDYWNVRKIILFKVVGIAFLLALIYLLQAGFLFDMVGSVADGKYSNYEATNDFGVGNLLVRLPLLTLFLFYLKDLKIEYGGRVVSFYYLMIFDVIISQSRYVYGDFERLTQYSNFGEMFLISLFYDFIRKKVQFPMQLIYLIVVIAYFTFYMYKWAILSKYGLMPYRFLEW